MRVLVTGGAGFVGHHMVEAILRNTNWEVVSLDRLDTSGNLNRLTDLECWDAEKKRISIVHHDLKAPISGMLSSFIGPVQVILHLAAASHVDRSIEDPLSFVMDNVVGTCNLLEYARHLDSLSAMVYFSTDEVFGPAANHTIVQQTGEPFHVGRDLVNYGGLAETYLEWDRYKSANPYAATKAGAEELCLAYHNTYKLPIVITHCMNIVGARQHPEKYVPSCIKKILNDETVIIHADKTRTKPGSRFYIHARNVADAVLFLLRKGTFGDKYNIVGEREVDNLELAQMIADIIQKPLKYELISWHESRPGHDLRYSLSGEKMAALGWKLPVSFEDSMRANIKWYLEHPKWLS